MRVAATRATIRTVLAPFIATLRPDEPVLLSVAAAHFVIYERLHQDADLVVSPTAPHKVLHISDSPLRGFPSIFVV